MTTPSPIYREGIEAITDHGEAEFVPDPQRSDAWTLLVDGVAQSYVSLDHPRHLEFAYVRLVVAAIEAHRASPHPLDVMHLGGGGLTVPRYLMATRPGSGQRVIEYDRRLLELVLAILPLPEGHSIELVRDDARSAIEATAGDSFDVVISDVFQAARMPTTVASVEFANEVMRVLRPGGIYVANVVDLPPLTLCRIHAATARATFRDVCVMAAPTMLRARRYGNVVIVAGTEELPMTRLAKLAGREARVLHGAELDAFVMGTGPMHDAD